MKHKKIGVICAMESEARILLAALSEKEEKEVGGIRFYTGKIGAREVVLAVCGIGKVFAAMCAQAMILHFAPDSIINSGVAGSLSDALSILDFAVSKSLVQHDMDTSPLGDPVGLVSGINRIYFDADEELRKEILEKASLLGHRAVLGTIASGDQFIARPEQKEAIISRFGAIACEMEGAAIAQVAFVNSVPFVVLRAISDSYSGQNEMDYALFAEKAAERGAALLLEVIRG
jgi:adenosylhomocysteine nucleosidase